MFAVSADLVKASKELCASILEEAGGSSAIANSLKLDRQYVHKCIRLGFVPFTRVYDVASLLGVSAWALSYYRLLEVFGEEESPRFRSVVGEAPLLPAEKRRILNLVRG